MNHAQALADMRTRNIGAINFMEIFGQVFGQILGQIIGQIFYIEFWTNFWADSKTDFIKKS